MFFTEGVEGGQFINNQKTQLKMTRFWKLFKFRCLLFLENFIVAKKYW